MYNVMGALHSCLLVFIVPSFQSSEVHMTTRYNVIGAE